MARTRQSSRGWYRPADRAADRRSARLQRVSPYPARSTWQRARVESVRRQFEQMLDAVFAFGAVLMEEEGEQPTNRSSAVAPPTRSRRAAAREATPTDVAVAAQQVAELQFGTSAESSSSSSPDRAPISGMLLQSAARLHDLAARVALDELADRNPGSLPDLVRAPAAAAKRGPTVRAVARARTQVRTQTPAEPPRVPSHAAPARLTAEALERVRPRSPSIQSIDSMMRLPTSGDTESIDSQVFRQSVKSSSSTDTELLDGYSGDEERE